jgi:Na+/H+ antiporter NhaD/arsenite permease-like protein
MSILGIVLAIAGALIALASNWLTQKMPWDPADNAVQWLKPWAWHLFAFGLGMTVGGL